MSNAQTAQSHPEKNGKNKTPEADMCIACCEHDCILIRPCTCCSTIYCEDCVVNMFLEAIVDGSRMPPRCCALLQIHTAINSLNDKEASDYRAKFEEWIAPVKTYCPAPTCSLFIPDRKLPREIGARPEPPLQINVLSIMMMEVAASSAARFFRGDIDTSKLPRYSDTVKQPMHLQMIREKINCSTYTKVSEVTTDMNLIVSNACDYNGPDHPVTHAANELFAKYVIVIGDALDRLITSSVSLAPTQSIFPCPKCHIAICTRCKQVEHNGSPCDFSAHEDDIAMLSKFGYKQCPRCKAGVKKMWGCSHMECHCGAHWCFYCVRPIQDCGGACNEEDYFDDDEEDSMEIDHVSAADGAVARRVNPDSQVEPSPAPANTIPPSTSGAPKESQDDVALQSLPIRSDPPSNSQPPPAAAASTTQPFAPVPQRRTINLDGGSSDYWHGQTHLDFGGEPDEDPPHQVWACVHSFLPFHAPPPPLKPDEIKTGDLSRMECNRCFEHVVAKPHATAQRRDQARSKGAGGRKRRRSRGVDRAGMDQAFGGAGSLKELSKNPGAQEEGKEETGEQVREAFKCKRCQLLVCPGCRDRYLEERKKRKE